MPTLRQTVYLAIPMPSIEFGASETGWAREALYDTLDELCRLSGKLPLDFLEYGIHYPRVELLDDAGKSAHDCWIAGLKIEYCEILMLDIDISFSVETCLSDSEKQRSLPVHHCLIQSLFIKRVSDILLAANIARPGSIELVDSRIAQNGVIQSYTHVPTMEGWVLQDGVELANTSQWPPIRNLPFDQVWTWIRHKGLLTDGFNSGATGRSVAAFSRTFEKERIDSASTLVWAMIGIEALYVTGKTSVVEQVRDKILSFLGSQPSYRKQISQLYETRSRFIHGDLDFPGIYVLADASTSIEQYDKKHAEAANLALVLLVASLQELIVRGWHNIKFTYVASNSTD